MVIYNYLSKGKKATVSEIVNYVKLTQPTVSYHLNEMKKNGILVREKQGKEVYYSVGHICPHYDTLCVLEDINFPQKKYA